MATIAKVFGWFELAVSVFAALVCGKEVFRLTLSGPAGPFDLAYGLAPIVIAITLPISLSLAWGGWHLVKRQDWLHQAAPLLVIVAASGFIAAYEL